VAHELTIQVLTAVLTDGVTTGLWRTLMDLEMTAAMHIKPEPPDLQGDQVPLF
jgi:hypothetical protein